MTFGERLRELREDHDITQKVLAAVIGVSPRMVSFYESGAHFPRDESTLIKLASYFDVTTDYLLGYSNVRNAEQFKHLAHSFGLLSDSEREGLLQYLDFLLSKQK